MGTYLNPGFDKFKKILNDKIYIDKSEILDVLNEHLNTESCNICISRPRRFGKSVTASMLCAYYSKNVDSAPLFDDLKISRAASYREHINQHNTIFINVQLFLSRAKGNIDRMTADLNSFIKKELSAAFPDSELSSLTELYDVLNRIYNEYNQSFIFIIDEWDCIMREKLDDAEGIKKYLDYLRALLKDQPYVSLAYMTGILPIKKYGSHSALNMFYEYSMTQPGEYSSYIGFTDEEVKRLCEEYQIDYRLMQRWYRGYSLEPGLYVYNSNSVVRAVLARRFSGYWSQTETFESLRKYIDLNMEGLRDEIVKLIAGEKVVVNVSSFHNDMTTFKSKDDVLSLLIHLGYLSVTPDSEVPEADNDLIFEVHIPNEEIRKEFRVAVKDCTNYQGLFELIFRTNKLLENIYSENSAEVARLFDEAHQENTSILKYNDENSLACVIALSLQLSTTDTYSVFRELPSGKGFADMVYLPKPGVEKPALLVELKYDKTAESAISQIKAKNSTQALKDYHGDIFLVGINYSKDTKAHECAIEKITR